MTVLPFGGAFLSPCLVERALSAQRCASGGPQRSAGGPSTEGQGPGQAARVARHVVPALVHPSSEEPCHWGACVSDCLSEAVRLDTAERRRHRRSCTSTTSNVPSSRWRCRRRAGSKGASASIAAW